MTRQVQVSVQVQAPTELRRRAILQAIGIQLWETREKTAEVSALEPSAGAQGADWPAPNLDALRQRVAECARCSLHRSRSQTVFGVGNPAADCMVIGEAPGAEEDRRGEPFVGRAGVLLNAMLQAVGFTRQDVYIANILKCRPPNNRDPLPAEVSSCSDYLTAQIEGVSPKVILTVGKVAAQNLLALDLPIGRMRGGDFFYRAGGRPIPVVVTYHPAYLLRSPGEKRKAWDDLKRLRNLLVVGDS